MGAPYPRATLDTSVMYDWVGVQVYKKSRAFALTQGFKKCTLLSLSWNERTIITSENAMEVSALRRRLNVGCFPLIYYVSFRLLRPPPR
jgi:hypothetical protein